MLSRLSHNLESYGNSYEYYVVLQFWQRLGLQTRQNKDSEYLEHVLSFPNQQIIGRVFTIDNWVGIQFNQPVEQLFPGNSKLGVQLAKLLKVSSEAVATLRTGFVIFTGKKIFYPTCTLIREISNGRLEAVGGHFTND